MRKSFRAVLVTMLALPGSIGGSRAASGPVERRRRECGERRRAVSTERAPLSNFRIHVRNANTDELAGSTVGTEAGQFSFSDLKPGNYVVELVGASGKVVGLSSSLPAAAGSTVTVTVGAVAAGALAAVWRQSQRSGSWSPGERRGGRRNERIRGDASRGYARRAHRRVPQEQRCVGGAVDQRVRAREPRRTWRHNRSLRCQSSPVNQSPDLTDIQHRPASRTDGDEVSAVSGLAKGSYYQSLDRCAAFGTH